MIKTEKLERETKSKSKRKSRSILLESSISFVAAIVLVTASVTPALAEISENELRVYCDNAGACYYNPFGNNCETVAVGSASGETSAGLSPQQAAFVDMYHDIAEQLSIAYGIPWETVIAQGIVESAAGTSNFAVQRNNFFGIGAFDSNLNNAYSYDTPTDGWRGYYENIRKTSTYRAHGVFRGDNITDPYAYLRTIKEAGYATDPIYVETISKIIAAVEERSKEKGWKSSAELAQEHPEMLENAAKNADGSGSDSEAPELTSNAVCISGSGNGDINQTALELSWPERGHDPWNDPKPEYALALQETGVNKLGDNCSMNGNSCDAFVATVLRYSGVDPDAPCCGAENLLNYFASHPEKYAEIPNTGNSSNMEPGDIRVRGGNSAHVELFVQREDGTYGIASASHCDRTADYGIGYYSDSSYRIFRAVQSVNNSSKEDDDEKQPSDL